MRRRVVVALLATTLGVLAGCDVVTGACVDDLSDEQPFEYRAGSTEEGIYRSSSWEPDAWVDFPPGASIRFEHELGTTPAMWQAYVATSREGLGDRLVLASGSEVELVAIDDQAIVVRNATCADFFVVLVALGTAPPTP